MTPRQRQRLRRAQERRRRRGDSPSLTSTIVMLVLLFASAMLFALVLANWILGCGQTYATANGDRIAGECIVLEWKPRK